MSEGRPYRRPRGAGIGLAGVSRAELVSLAAQRRAAERAAPEPRPTLAPAASPEAPTEAPPAPKDAEPGRP